MDSPLPLRLSIVHHDSDKFLTDMTNDLEVFNEFQCVKEAAV